MTRYNPSEMNVRQLLASPAVVHIVLSEAYQARCVGGRVLSGRIDATGSGAAVIERAGLFTEGEPEPIPELGSYPSVGGGEDHQVVAADKWGLRTIISAEAIAHNRVDLVRTRMLQMAATLARAVDVVTFRAIAETDDIATLPASGAWLGGASSDPFHDVMNAAAMIDELDLGVSADTVVVSPTLYAALVSHSKVLEAAPRDAQDSTLLTGSVFTFGGLSILKTTRDFGADVLVCNAEQLGSLVYEWLGGGSGDGWTTSTADPDGIESTVGPLASADGTEIRMRKVVAPVITMPQAAVTITGAAA